MTEEVYMQYYMVYFCKVQQLHKWPVRWAICILLCCKFIKLLLYRKISRSVKIWRYCKN